MVKNLNLLCFSPDSNDPGWGGVGWVGGIEKKANLKSFGLHFRVGNMKNLSEMSDRAFIITYFIVFLIFKKL